ncbi:hypothetical protein [Micromonospora sp. NPDC023814]|uniref:hypothetical protein n=1 Tax=Micromonospora sp. NPDC023814 TaxID=3154596 RepID=UPI0033D1C4C3
MSYDLRFVDSISATPAVRLNLMAAPWAVQSATEFGTPELRRATAGTLLTDGEQYPAAAYGNRAITLVARVVGVDQDAAAAALQTLYRELDRPSNLLEYRPSTSEPVFFRTFRAAPGSVTWDPFLMQATAVIPAEPFAYGLREALPQVTVYNDPAAPANGGYFDVVSPKGDVETPLFLRLEQGSITDFRQSIIAVRRRGTPSLMPLVAQAESMALGTDAALGAAGDPAMSGSGQNYVRVSFSTSTALIPRVSVLNWPAAGPDARGTYRAFLRVRQSNPTESMTLRLEAVGGGWMSESVVPAVGPGTAADYVDMGLVQIPTGADPVTDGYSGVTLSTQSPGFHVYVGRSSGAGTLDIDHLLLVPADDRLCLISWPADSGLTALVLDSARTMAYAVGSGGEVRRPAQQVPIVGAPPMVSPGVANRIVFVQDTGALQSDAANRLTSTTVITPYYWPRYLYVRPVAS